MYSAQVAIHGGRQYICQAAHQITATAAPLNSKSKSTNQCRGKYLLIFNIRCFEMMLMMNATNSM